jgi:hypothetical protein
MRDRLCVLVLGCCLWTGCTVKAVGDPNRPITINAHVVVDIRGLEKTASNIEDYVSGEKPSLETKNTKEVTK